MNINSIFITIFFLSIYIIFKKFNIFIDEAKYSEHKIIGKENNKPIVLGGIFLIFVVLLLFDRSYLYLKIFSLSVFLIGHLSDRNYLSSPKIRLVIQIIAFAFFVVFENLKINSVNINFLDNLLENKYLNLLFIVFCLSVLVNGTNFIDGLNGLVSGYFLLILVSILYTAKNPLPDHPILFSDLNLIKILATSLIIFFIFNIFGKVYLGDSGSYLVAFLTGYLLIKINLNNNFISPFFVVNMLWYPAFENLFSLIRRLINNSNISHADRLHLHQLIYRYFRSKKIFNPKIINTFSTFIIILFNLPIFIFSTNFYYHTKFLILILVMNLLLYLSLYLLLSKNFKIKK